ncbi:MAG: alpha,alpha-trehalose-phosphate synthase (UDP-forming) [Geminicoccaceae bacterium]|nr:alpha,alpha-trehalose-phosphate synthase (UDP-forming) [Geminicoccaceae bacterium]
MSRLVVVSNRVTPITSRQVSSAGGLAVGVHAALKDTGGLWFGWSGETGENPREEPKVFRTGKVTYGLVDLNTDDFEAYYSGFSNRTLWPLFHYRLDLASFEHQWYSSYRKVNQRFAEALFPLLRHDDVIWIHDYQLIPMATELRRLGVTTRIGFFLHIPFPTPEIYLTLPWHRQLSADMANYDLIGFQTGTDQREFSHYIEHELNGTVKRGTSVEALGRQFTIGTYPIGIDVDDVMAMSRSAEARKHADRVRATLPGDRKLMIGVDRLDYTKGLIERLRAYEMLLQDYPALRRQMVLMQISAPSREDVPEYTEIRQQVELMSGHINGTYSESDWVPLRYINRSHTRRVLTGFFRISRVCLVTPLRDGMNLVAEEYVASQDPDDPGVLVLSRFAGCARILEGALIVNPYDVYHVADTLHAALNMPLAERQDRWQRMMQSTRRNDINAWRERFLRDLCRKTGDASEDGVAAPN